MEMNHYITMWYLPPGDYEPGAWRISRSWQGQRRTFLFVKNLLRNCKYSGWDEMTRGGPRSGAHLTTTDLARHTEGFQLNLAAHGFFLRKFKGRVTWLHLLVTGHSGISVAWRGSTGSQRNRKEESHLCCMLTSLWFSLRLWSNFYKNTIHFST